MTNMADDPFDLSAQRIESATQAAMAIVRAKGVPLPRIDEVEDIFSLGFAEGALWLLRRFKEIAESQPAKKE